MLSLIYILEANGLIEAATYWSQVLEMNNYQKRRLAEKIASHFPEPNGVEIAIYGFAFKKNTSDTRATPIAFLVNYLIEKGFTVKIHDPQVNERGFQMEMEVQGFNIAEKTNYIFCGSDYTQATKNTSAIVIGTEWDEYQNCNYRQLRDMMNKDQAFFFDLRSYLDPTVIHAAGFDKVFKLGN